MGGHLLDFWGVIGEGMHAGFAKIIGNAEGTKFVSDVWTGDFTLKVKFNRLFRISAQRESLVSECENWGQNGWVWELQWSWELRGESCLCIMITGLH